MKQKFGPELVSKVAGPAPGYTLGLVDKDELADAFRRLADEIQFDGTLAKNFSFLSRINSDDYNHTDVSFELYQMKGP